MKQRPPKKMNENERKERARSDYAAIVGEPLVLSNDQEYFEERERVQREEGAE